MGIEPLTHLGDLPVAEFMRRYWQRRPVLIRRALPDFVAPVTRERLFALARRADVESRLVTAFDRWRLRHGPITRLPSPRRRRWTLLVQGVNLHDDGAAALLARFRFIADARLDDLMVSYATDGGGVGPHIDTYDVFLLQAQGQRRWRIGPCQDPSLRPGLPLAILRRFTPTRQWVLQPGDILYLPPGVAHEGVAVGHDCMTYSIGFRAPAWQELLNPWLDTLAQRWQRQGRYRDPGAPVARHPARLPPALIERTFAIMRTLQPRRRDALRMLLSELTEPKPFVTFESPARPLSRARFAVHASRGSIRLDRRTRLLYAEGWAACNGELFPTDAAERRLLHALADARSLDGKSLREAPLPLWNRLWTWYLAGWLHVDGGTK
ncbi:MAG: cupin domain-containing protein [Sutterellaceae bacterium]|nr:AraC family ligand binding domain-containing protein [Burkholderiaceae bacterium]MCX7901481.1 AraC family ligand binding domain-containing protein [Burkholderiaceae bacterium]MDW8430788.1 cupin domain-containing protein [Sutterellaceae bacterium]